MPQFSFNPQQYDFARVAERLPRGWYPAIIKESELIPTANKDGIRLIFHYEIIDGLHKGRKVQGSHNVQNPSAKAMEISLSEVKSISAAVGVFAPINQTEELHNRPLQIHLTEPKDSEFNDVKGWKTINGDDPSKSGGATQMLPQGPVAVPAQGFGNAAPVSPYPGGPTPYGAPPQQFQQPQYAQPPAQPQYAQQPQQPQYQQQPQAPGAQPAWAQPPVQQQPQQAAPVYQQQAQQQPPTWQPNQAPAPAAPAWAQQ
jgi:hypothetical protein